jgi:hypothetical protein
VAIKELGKRAKNKKATGSQGQTCINSRRRDNRKKTATSGGKRGMIKYN